MKQVYFVGGTMGVGKTTTAKALKTRLHNSVLLDGDWCWDMNPFIVNGETKQMVIENICFVLNNFIKCTVFENIIFCWVMHEQAIVDEIVSRLDVENCTLHMVSLISTKQALQSRWHNDIVAGTRTEDGIYRSIQRLPLYEKLDTIKVDVSEISAEEAAEYIIANCQEMKM